MKIAEEEIVDISKLVKGTTILVETTAKIFEFTILTPQRAMLRTSGSDFKEDLPCQIIGSLSKTGTLFAGKIVKEKHLVISIPRGRITTGLVRSASLRGCGWTYEMWKD